MCGITGFYSSNPKYPVAQSVLGAMTEAIHHRGPDETTFHYEKNLAFGVKRLSIIDLANGHQPFFSEDGSVALVCNGEIYNHGELRHALRAKGYAFKTNCDVEVLINLYLEYGMDFIGKLNGQFAFALFDKTRDRLLLARDHFGICPLFYTQTDQVFVFGSEIKCILEHPVTEKKVNLMGLDQIFSFPGIVSPCTMFEGIHSLKPGHYVELEQGRLRTGEYWDLDYPLEGHAYEFRPESYYVDRLEELLLKSVAYRLNAEVPVGFYLSGGIDSSLVGAMMKSISPRTRYHSFSIGFPGMHDAEYDERRYQRLMAGRLDSVHHEISFDWQDVGRRLREAVRHSECPLKETYNTCSLALSEAAHQEGLKVILSGEGADELLGGYVGYRFDVQRSQAPFEKDLEHLLEDQVRKKLWGDADFYYENNQYEFKQTKQALYSEAMNRQYADFDCLERLDLNVSRLEGRHVFHKRSYVDLKLRLADHLIADHCDRVCYANSVEGRYPFLDIELVNFISTIPPQLKLKNLVEKYILRQVSQKYLPPEIINRQKFSFVAPASTQLLRNNIEWVNDALSYDRIKKDGYFNPDTVERLKKIYTKPGFSLNLPFDNDLLIVVLTFNVFLDEFQMPAM